MASYEIRFRRSVAKDLEPFPRKDLQAIITSIQRLAADPRPPQSRKLTVDEKYRLRCGRYRILYEIQDERLIVGVAKVAHRNDVSLR